VSSPRTPSQTVGPFYSIGLCRRAENQLVTTGTELHGTLYDGAGEPIGDGVIELWDALGRRWGRCGTNAEGRFSFVVTKPDAPEGQAPHLHAFVFARGLLRQQLTRIYFPDEANDEDPVFASLPEDARDSLVALEEDGALRFEIHMQGERATVFFAH
jgi:protocatechuate 3,4-dioxygenase, alpha subunit